MSYLCNPKRKTGYNKPQVWQDKFIEKTVLLYKKQVPRKNNLSRSVDSFERIESVRDKLRNIIMIIQ